jgi:hypothetical protein
VSLKKKLNAMKRQIEGQEGGWDAHLEKQGYRKVNVLKRPTVTVKLLKKRKTGSLKKVPTR